MSIEIESSEQQQTESEENSFRQIFQIYDQEQSGSIRTEQFILITQNIIKENGLADQIDLNSIVSDLDPFGIGILNYDQFKDGIKRITNSQDTNKTNTEMKEDESLSDNFLKNQNFYDKEFSAISSPVSDQTFAEYDSDFFEKTPSTTGKSNFGDEEADLFNLDINEINNHSQKVLASSKSYSNFYDQSLSKKKLLKDRSFQNLPQDGMKDSNDDGPKFGLNYDISQHTIENYETHLELNEKKIKELSDHIEILLGDKNELMMQIDKIRNDYVIIQDKYNELVRENDKNVELERIIDGLRIENNQLKSEIKNLNVILSEDRTAFLVKSKSFEEQLNLCKSENSKISLELDLLLKKNQECEMAYHQLKDELNKLNEENKRLTKEREIIKNEMNDELDECYKKIDLLENEFKNSKLENEKLEQTIRNYESKHVEETSHSIFTQDESLAFQNKETIESVNRKINHLFDDEQVVSSTFGMVAGSSLASEIDDRSKDELLKRIAEEQHKNARLYEYIDNIVAKIMEKSPDLLEACLNVNKRK